MVSIYNNNFSIYSRFFTAHSQVFSGNIESDCHVNLSGDNNQNKNALYDVRMIIKNENLSVAGGSGERRGQARHWEGNEFTGWLAN